MIQSQLFFNKCFDKNKLKGLISWSLRNYGEATTLDLVEKLKNVGFFWATQAGISLSIDDLKIPKEKSSLLLDAEKLSKLASQQFSSGNVTTVERLQQMIDAWHRTSENLKQEVVSNFRRTDPLNPVYMMAFSGARGNISQVRQLVGMRGLMADPQGRIIDFPIRSNFREGLTLTEYVISCYGARKGIVDTALRTATSGYLTRRLVDVAQHVVVSNYDCGTDQGIPLNPLKQGSKILLPLSDRILGRVLAEDVDGIASKNTCISEYLSFKLSKTKDSILVRSPLLCKSKNGVCQLCYGWSLAHNDLVSIGEAVGIIAAQSIGEPGTQLTMRTFHTGGVFSGEIIDQIQSPLQGIVAFPNVLKGSLVRTSYGKIGFLTREAGVLSIQALENSKKQEQISFPTQSILFVRQGQRVEKNEIILEYASAATDQDQGIQSSHLVTAPQKGEVFFEDVVLTKDEETSEAESCQLGSFWLLTSHLHTQLETVNGSFHYGKGDLLLENGSVMTTKLMNSTSGYPALVKSLSPNVEKESYNTTIPSLRTKLFDLSVPNLTYSSGLYSGILAPSFVAANYISSDKQSVFSFLDQTVVSFPSLSRALNRSSEEKLQTKANLFFLSSTSSFWFLCEKAKISPKNSFKKKLFYFAAPTRVQPFSLPLGQQKQTQRCGSYNFKQGKPGDPVLSDSISKFYSIQPPVERFKELPQNWTFVLSDRFGFTNFSMKTSINSTVFFQRRLKPVLNQIPLHFLLYCYSRRRNNFVLTMEQEFKQISVNQRSILQLSRKTSCLGTISLGFTSFLSSTSLSNKQSVDKSLHSKTNFIFEFESVYKDQQISLGLHQFRTTQFFDNVNWSIDQTGLQTISVSGITKMVVPSDGKKLETLKKKDRNNFLEWNFSKRKLVEDKVILGQIDKKTNETVEMFKPVKFTANSKLLYIKKADCCALEISPGPQNEIKAVLGSLIRPGKELVNDSTVQISGQILSIGKNYILIRRALPILFSSKASFHVFHGDFIEKGLPLITLTYKRLTTGDIVQGIPRIEQLFEARQTTTVLHEQLHELFETYKTRMRVDLAARKSFQKIQRILIDSIQRVYQSQGVSISDKHLEIIVRQMTSTVRILEGGRTRLLRGELKPIEWIEKVNLGIDIQKAEYEPILLGITKASLETESFISAASFQETTKTLSRAAIEGRTDFLRGLKETVILGHRIPAGTGAPLINYLTKFSLESEMMEDVSSELNLLLKE